MGALLALLLSCPVLTMGQDPSGHVEYQIVFHELHLSPAPIEITAVVGFQDLLYVADVGVHQVVVYQDGSHLRSLGGIGNAPGELFYPSHLFVDLNGVVYVRDSGNRRVQMLDSMGRYLGEIADEPRSWGLAASSQGEVFLGQPGRGTLVGAYDQNGKLATDFGELLAPAEVFRSEIDNEEVARRALNRVHLTTDHADNVWVAFQHDSVLRKYSPEGRLLLEKRLQWPGLEILKTAVSERTLDTAIGVSINIDGIQLTVVLKDIEYDWTSKTVVVLLGDDRLAGFDTNGQPRFVASLVGIERIGSLTSFTLAESGTEVLLASRSHVLAAEVPWLQKVTE